MAKIVSHWFSIMIPLLSIIVLYGFYHIGMVNTSGSEKWSPQGVNTIRYAFSFFDVGYGNNDSLASIFVPRTAKHCMQSPFCRWISTKLYVNFSPYSRFLSAIMLRTEFYDNIWIDSIQRNGIKQIVNIGAGFDDRAVRFTDLLLENNVKVFELDLPRLLQRKKEILLQYFNWNKLPSYLGLIPCDLEKVKLMSCLHKNKYFQYSSNIRTLFHLEGIVMYLDSTTVDKIFTFIQHNSPKGSTVAFGLLIDSNTTEINALKNLQEKRGEKYTFMLQENNVIQFIQQYDLKIIKSEGVRDAVLKYLPKDINDRFPVPLSNWQYLNKAEV